MCGVFFVFIVYNKLVGRKGTNSIPGVWFYPGGGAYEMWYSGLYVLNLSFIRIVT